ncbi:MAG: iron donor protein CyaY [Alphaproteobacteria bacterium]|nr:iron donor protein CyaY [Alphaproteobacteria bacterium]
MEESGFERAADALLTRLLEAIEESGADVDADLQGGVLMVEFADGRQLLVNKHGPNRQIWLSSPLSGARHFDPDPATGGWKDTRDGRAFADVLAEDFPALAGAPLRIA